MATHNFSQIDEAVDKLSKAFKQLGVINRVKEKI
jgi:hypothetical protein